MTELLNVEQALQPGATRGRLYRLASDPRAPLACLALIAAFSLGARLLFIERPCATPCRTAADHRLIFDEAYYVNAARTIAGVEVPAGATYAGSPAGRDPNAEHPQLGKLVMAGGIKLFGDGPLGWRAGSLAAGTVVLLLLFALVRTAGGGPWLGVGVAGVASLDNLLMVHGRIAMLDVYALAFMLGAAILYLRERPLSAGLVLGVGACVKLVSGYLLFAFGVMEALRWLHRRRGTTVSVAAAGARATALALCIAATGIGYAVTLQGLDLAVKPYDPGSARTYSNALDHTRHMLDSATRIVSPGGPQGIASYPWTWLEGRGTIPYLTVQTEARTSGKVVRRETVVAFTGAVNPFVLFLVIPALALAIRRVWTDGETLDVLAVGWFAGMVVPFSLQAAFEDRTTYLYYIVVALPALYVAVVRLVQRLPPAAVIGWVLALMIGFADLYPFPQIM